MISKFYSKNIKIKSQFLQEEHKRIMKYLYNLALDEGTVDKYESKIAPNHAAYYDKLLKVINDDNSMTLGEQEVNTCLLDLYRLGFIDIKLYCGIKYPAYNLTDLGLKYAEFENM